MPANFKTPRLDLKVHRRFVASWGCVVCALEYAVDNRDLITAIIPEPHFDPNQALSQCAHIRAGMKGGMGLKPGDHHTVPLCPDHHREFDAHQPTFAVALMDTMARWFASRSPVIEIRNASAVERKVA
jgi:hypothetical protein